MDKLNDVEHKYRKKLEQQDRQIDDLIKIVSGYRDKLEQRDDRIQQLLNVNDRFIYWLLRITQF